MFKNFFLPIVVPAILVFAGCIKQAVPASSAPVNVELLVWESANGPDEFIKQAGEAYTSLHPNVTIKFANVGLRDSVRQIALTGPAKVGPDLFAAPHDRLGELVTNGHILPAANADSIKDNLLDACLTATTYNGVQYGYPVSAETYALFYNKVLIHESEVPKTWTSMINYIKNFDVEGKYAFLMDVGNAYYSIIFTTKGGNRLFGPDGTDTKNTNLNSESAVAGMEFFQSIRQVLSVPAADISTSLADDIFRTGNAAMYISGPWNVRRFVGAGLDIGIAPLPSLPGENTPAASFSGTRVMFVSAYSSHPDEANDFGAFLASPRMQQLRANITNTLPAIDVPTSNPYAAGFVEQLKYAFPMPSVPSMTKFWDAMNAASANIWNGANVKLELDTCNAIIVTGN
ncbi:MAG: maltose ABC transporter substrate-binding protein [Treponema sp.]|jgi:arabinogalactan oligomer/maltooligosaccharide transport system substrate-binding protein|nr:maltose ABC transporter substrate-binding protein [Treponema sp.]